MAQIAVYVQAEYAKKAYTVESYNVRAWPGMELIKDVLVRAGFDVDYCGAETVQDYHIILVSITCPIDWYSFISERVGWQKGDYTVIVGGPGVMDIRPVLPFADIFVFGRGEAIIIPLVKAVLQDQAYEHPAVAYAEDFSVDKTYRIEQTNRCYPFPITLANGKLFIEQGIGCQRKCLFCSYAWHRQKVGHSTQKDSGAGKQLFPSNDEVTFFELDLDHPDTWGRHLILGLDGMSYRLRKMVNKPITPLMLEKFAAHLFPGRHNVYCIVGYPGENEDDYRELGETLERGARQRKSTDPRCGFILVCTPFNAQPATPAATWPMTTTDFRGRIGRLVGSKLRNLRRGHSIVETDNFWVNEGWTNSLSSHYLWVLLVRGIEEDTDVVRMISSSKQFQRADSLTRLATLEKYLDIDRLVREYTWEDLPTRYLQTYLPNEGLARLSDWRARLDPLYEPR